jgi:hypothetical protein
VLVTIHNGYTSGRGLPVLCRPAPCFRVCRYQHGQLGTGKGNGAGRRSLVKYKQPLSTPVLELEELKLSFSVEGDTLGAQVPGRHEHSCR